MPVWAGRLPVIGGDWRRSRSLRRHLQVAALGDESVLSPWSSPFSNQASDTDSGSNLLLFIYDTV